MSTIEAIAEMLHASFNDRRMGDLYALWPDELVYEAPGVEISTKADRIASEEAILNAMPDAQVEVAVRYVSGSTFVEEGVMRGTHTGTLRTAVGDIPATGREVAQPYIGISTVREGKVVRQRIIYDRLALLGQLGLLQDGDA